MSNHVHLVYRTVDDFKPEQFCPKRFRESIK